MIAAIYSRKSIFTGKGESIENQIQMCREYARKNFNITKFLIYEDEGFSGGNTNRPKFQELLNDAKNKVFNVLICYRLDRISRNVADFSSTLELLEKNNINFISIKEQFDTNTPIGKAMVYIASVFAQLERETIAERVKDNMLELAKCGRWLGGQTPLGFKSEKIIYIDHELKEKSMYKLSPIKKELELVKIIYQKYYELKSLRKVTQWLLENKYETKLGGNWSVQSVSDLLQSPTYVMASKKVFNYLESKNITCLGIPNNKNGILTYNKKKGQNHYRDTSKWIAAIANHKGIINSDTWLEIQSILNKNKVKAPRLGKTHNALLTGILRCGKCGSPMCIVHGKKDKDGKKIYYYTCSMKTYSKGTRCNNSNIRADEVENVVLTHLKKFSISQQYLKQHLKNTTNQFSHFKKNTTLNNLTKSKKQEENAISNLVKQLSINSNSVAAKYIISEIEKRENKINKINNELMNIKNTSKTKLSTDINSILNEIKNMNHFIDDENNKNKKIIISSLIKNITWDSSIGELIIEFWGSLKNN